MRRGSEYRRKKGSIYLVTSDPSLVKIYDGGGVGRLLE